MGDERVFRRIASGARTSCQKLRGYRLSVRGLIDVVSGVVDLVGGYGNDPR
jgi:hypothetical protein